ncbi:MAG TPA: hypothetical protein VLF20_04740 [Patescibacteria group bacterium]|nr:hypothetical protein [Patescibacteria group bacterium]
MSKLLYAFLIFFVFLLTGLGILVYAIYSHNQTSSPLELLIAVPATPTPTDNTSYSLTLSSVSPAILPNQTNTIAVLIEKQETNANPPDTIQIEIAYDPNALLSIDIKPGTYFTTATERMNLINYQQGRISYAISGTALPEGSTGTVAFISFIPNPAFQGKETSLYFLPKSMIRGKTDTNLLKATYGTKLFFATQSATPKNNPILPITQ